jgi:hypothetical protein
LPPLPCLDTVLSTEGANQSLTGTAVDVAGNSASDTVKEIHIDLTRPTVTYTGNGGNYTVDQQVNITCLASDNLSGVLSDTCKEIVGPAYSFALGTNNFSASATDKAGNVGQASTSFTVQVTHDSLCSLVNRFVTDPSVAASLCEQLSAAQAAQARGNLGAKANIMAAFISLVQAQTGKSITLQNAATLTQLAQAI